MWNKILTYLYLRKSESDGNNINLKMMHKVNRLSILMFLFAMVVLIIRFAVKS
ncbi:MAG: hypothetical protein HYZ42_09435 [Bacteroidetes bacterium]|nr:hypothetical protein [Bacteroidota bacterium]